MVASLALRKRAISLWLKPLSSRRPTSCSARVQPQAPNWRSMAAPSSWKCSARSARHGGVALAQPGDLRLQVEAARLLRAHPEQEQRAADRAADQKGDAGRLGQELGDAELVLLLPGLEAEQQPEEARAPRPRGSTARVRCSSPCSPPARSLPSFCARRPRRAIAGGGPLPHATKAKSSTPSDRTPASSISSSPSARISAPSSRAHARVPRPDAAVAVACRGPRTRSLA